MAERLPDYYARRWSVVYAGLSAGTRAELERACWERGVRVHIDGRLWTPGYYRGGRKPTVFLHPDAEPYHAAHELFHAWLDDNIAHGVEYPAPDWEQGDEEQAADRFAEIVTR